MQFFQAKPALAEEASSISLDDFEVGPQGWEYVGGWEFPGAKGSLEWDTTTGHNGRGCVKLDGSLLKVLTGRSLWFT